jgi:hypothetical protein
MKKEPWTSTSTKSCRTTSADMPSFNLLRAVMHGIKPNRAVILSASDEDARSPLPLRAGFARRILTERICNHVCLRGDAGISVFLSVPAAPANSPCQAAMSVVSYFLGTSVGASLASPRPLLRPKNNAKIAQFLCNVSPLLATLLDLFISVVNKGLMENLSPLNATLTKKGGWGCSGGAVPSPPVCVNWHPLPKERPCALTP